ncbi:MAG: hypothetical protein M3506_09440 [Chloroflexota bacterium]|nr:hypothetical protein [Chloroflexota bacterium]
MTAEQVRDCLQYYIGFFPARELDDRTIKLFGVKLLPLDYETAMQAIDAACETPEAAKGFLPAWGAVSQAYRVVDERKARASGWLGQGTGWASAPRDGYSSPALSAGESTAIVSNVQQRLAVVRERMTPDEYQAWLAEPLPDRKLYKCPDCQDAGRVRTYRYGPVQVISCGCQS